MAKGFVTDLRKCVGCKACEAVCKIRYASPEGVSRRRVPMRDTENSRIFVSIACNHCDEPSCLPACPKGAISKDAEGIVTRDLAKCVGCRRCEWACPYGAIVFDPTTQKIDKCDGCVTFPDGPRCVEACHATALDWVDVDGTFTDDAAQIVLAGEELLPDPAFTEPNVKFIKTPDVS